MRVIGTAGHVDHGKSTLVQALTGIDPDRLKEEKARQMTIDLGFAWMTLPSGLDVSIVDVPGHEDFIKNMLAGVGGIDLAMLVVAADEAVMPQTREHLAILDLLRVRRGIVALTKIDLIEDEEWLALVQDDVRDVLRGTILENAPIVPVSARTGVGLDELRATLDRLLADIPPRPDVGRPRLPIDRVFTVAGFGTVVTGTLSDGTLHVGDEVEILPRGLRGRIRGMQTHRHPVETAAPGRRLAINVSGVDVNDVARGDVLVKPGTYRPTYLVDATLHLLPDAPKPLRHNAEVEFFVGASQVMAHVRLIGVRELRPGERGYVQLRFDRPVVVARNDRFIIRQPSPSRTLGGGRILDPHPGRRWRRFREQTLARFRLLDEGDPLDLLVQTLRRDEPIATEALLAQSPLPPETTHAALEQGVREGRIRRLAEHILLSAEGWSAYAERLQRLLKTYHAQHPLRLGMPREEAASRLGLSSKHFAALREAFCEEGWLVEENGLLRLSTFQVRLRAEQQAAVDQLLAAFRAHPTRPPSASEAARMVGEDVLDLLIARGDLVRVSADVLFLPETYAQMVERIQALIRERGSVTVAEVRDQLETSRKYAVALLEHLDERRITRRVGDARVLR
ncbi:selenocysteine-specific translation elongation factor [Ardenticatena maritima]|uniref:Selenocysteine-specific elongation factor n=3 Tax=Ardenticatena maritima TaxID=872965 RepID=A0A0P6Z095_9CHLR|nr:selenocysteine-specific translation elongation factor [Ardenticatena maritima]KPL90224.1 translation elongation factor [Ardenticatena maritima]